MQIHSPCPVQTHSSYSYLKHVMSGTWHKQVVPRFREEETNDQIFVLFNAVIGFLIVIVKRNIFYI